MINLENVPEPNDVIMHQCFVDVVLPNCMPYITLLLLFTPLSIQPMQLTSDISMFYQVISLLEISYFKITAKRYIFTVAK